MTYLYKKEDFVKTRENEEIAIYSAGFKNSAFSLVKAELKQEHDCYEPRESDITYYIVSGEASFDVEGNKFIAKSGDVVNIPKKFGYVITGIGTKIITINNPPFQKKG